MNRKMMIALAVIGFARFGASAQNHAPKVMDLIVTQVAKSDTAQTDSTLLLLQFKISEHSLSHRAHIMFGTTQNSSNVLDVQAAFVREGNKVYLDYNGHKSIVNNKEAEVLIPMLTTQYQAAKFATLEVKQNNGTNTSPQYFKLQ